MQYSTYVDARLGATVTVNLADCRSSISLTTRHASFTTMLTTRAWSTTVHVPWWSVWAWVVRDFSSDVALRLFANGVLLAPTIRLDNNCHNHLQLLLAERATSLLLEDKFCVNHLRRALSAGGILSDNGTALMESLAVIPLRYLYRRDAEVAVDPKIVLCASCSYGCVACYSKSTTYCSITCHC